MAPTKLYIGRRIRELRDSHGVTQASFAERLGISTSYLNQVENNQRPVSASVLLALAEKFGIDIASISAGEGERLLSALLETLADPLFDSYAPTQSELKLITQNAPGFARALIAAHQAYRRNSEQLASLDDPTGGGLALSEPTPYEEVRDFFHFLDNYVHALDTEAEALAATLGIGRVETGAVLRDHLESAHRIKVSADASDRDALRLFDNERRVLHLNPYLPAATRNFQLAVQVGLLQAQSTIDAIVRDAELRSPEARDICQTGLANYFAGALLLPYRTFLQTERELRHDLELLAGRFGASLEQVAHRLSTLQRPGHKGVPIFFARIDRAGNITKRHSAAKLQFARFGAACPLWNAHSAFEAPGRILRQLAETPDGARYLCVATELTKGGGGFHAVQRRYAITLGCEVTYAGDFVYADGLDLTNRAEFEKIGISCRICERRHCVQRAVPPLKSRLTVDQNERRIVPYKID